VQQVNNGVCARWVPGRPAKLTTRCTRHALARVVAAAWRVLGREEVWVKASYPRVRVSSGPLAPQESKVMFAGPLFREGFQLVDRNAPCKEVVGRVSRNSKSRASVTKFRQGQCPGFDLVGRAPLRSNAGLGRRLELGAERVCAGVLVLNRR
jgi:hypothetical protein